MAETTRFHQFSPRDYREITPLVNFFPFSRFAVIIKDIKAFRFIFSPVGRSRVAADF